MWCVDACVVAKALGWKFFERLRGETQIFGTLDLPPFAQLEN